MPKSSIITIIILVIVVIIGVVLWITMQNGASTYTQPTEQVQSTQTNLAPTQIPGSVATSASVSISNFRFAPATLNIKKGTTVTWTNNDSAPHTVTGSNGGLASQTLTTGQTYSYTFTASGTFSYYCSIHPTMKGTVIVN